MHENRDMSPHAYVALRWYRVQLVLESEFRDIFPHRYPESQHWGGRPHIDHRVAARTTVCEKGYSCRVSGITPIIDKSMDVFTFKLQA
jgi:hypothetical protein